MIKNTRILLFFLLGIISYSLNAKSLLVEPVPDKTFKETPGSANWKSFSSRKQMLAATAIEQKVLSKMSTDQLILVCLNWPLYGDLLAFNNLQVGIDRLIEDFNGLSELVSRPDVGAKLLRVYEKINPDQAAYFGELSEQGGFAAQLSYLQMIVAHPSVLGRMSSSERRALIKAAVDKYHAVLGNSHIFSLKDSNTLGLIMARATEMELGGSQSKIRSANKPEWLDSFLSGKKMASGEEIANIAAEAESFLNNN